MSSSSPSPDPAPHGRVMAEGKALRCGTERWFLNAVSYGPFRPDHGDAHLAEDFAAIRTMGFNCVRVYGAPSAAMLRQARSCGLKLIVGIAWTEHVDFLREQSWCHDGPAVTEIKRRVREAAIRYAYDETVAAILVGNEIEKTLVRWMGPEKVKRFLESLIDIVHQEAPHCLVSYATYPSTEYLVPVNADFIAVNVYLEDRAVFEKYVLRLQNLAGPKPLVITEFGLDVRRHGEARQWEVMQWQRDVCLRNGVAGNVWFSFTDEWFRGGEEVTGWSFGLVDRERHPRLAAGQTASLPVSLPAAQGPRISVVVCTRNGSATLQPCLQALGRQRYANREIIVIDDGSTDAVPRIAQSFSFARYVRQDHAGLSVARNLGASVATGTIIAYTDDDCVSDEDWLAQLSLAFDDPKWVAAGGPNIPPPPRNAVEAVVAHAPGGPSHVLLNDQEAEHLPGCNIAVRKDSLLAIGGFQAQFKVAGDDVDVCWRLREAGGCLRFCPGAFVWHHRRFTVRAYFRQQSGYGRAEALLMKAHPQRFGPLGGARWRGLIYGEPGATLSPTEGSIFHGPYGTGSFQVIYASGSGFGWWDWLGGVLWLAFGLLALTLHLPWLSAGLLLIAAAMAWRRMNDALLPSWGEKGLLWFLCLAQPIVREWTRLLSMIRLGARPSVTPVLPAILPPMRPRKFTRRVQQLSFWSETGVGRDQWMTAMREVMSEAGLTWREDDGWRWFDFELASSAHPQAPTAVGLVSVTEFHGRGKMLTSIAILRRSSRRLYFFWLAIFVLAWPVQWLVDWLFGAQSHVVPLSVLFPCALYLINRIINWPVEESKARDLVLKAAQRAGLKWIGDSTQAPHPIPSDYPPAASSKN